MKNRAIQGCRLTDMGSTVLQYANRRDLKNRVVDKENKTKLI